MKTHSESGGGCNNHKSLDESEVYFSMYMSPPSHMHHSNSNHVSYKMADDEPKMESSHGHGHGHGHGHRMVVAKGLDVDDEATNFILRRHRKLELSKFMSMAP